MYCNNTLMCLAQTQGKSVHGVCVCKFRKSQCGQDVVDSYAPVSNNTRSCIFGNNRTRSFLHLISLCFIKISKVKKMHTHAWLKIHPFIFFSISLFYSPSIIMESLKNFIYKRGKTVHFYLKP